MAKKKFFLEVQVTAVIGIDTTFQRKKFPKIPKFWNKIMFSKNQKSSWLIVNMTPLCKN